MGDDQALLINSYGVGSFLSVYNLCYLKLNISLPKQLDLCIHVTKGKLRGEKQRMNYCMSIIFKTNVNGCMLLFNRNKDYKKMKKNTYIRAAIQSFKHT